jgi:hypothetical protein
MLDGQLRIGAEVIAEREHYVCLAALALVGAVPVLLASCADTSSGDATEHPTEISVPRDAGGDATVDAGNDECDGGQDAGSLCTTRARTCEESDFCPVAAPIAGRTMLGVWGSGKTDVWAVGTGGTIVHFDGTAWAAMPSPTKQPIFTVWGSSASDVWIGSSRAAVFRGPGYQGTSTSWSSALEVSPGRNGQEAMMLTLWGSAKDDVWIGGEPYPLEGFTFASQWRGRAGEGGIEWAAARTSDGSPQKTPPVRGIWGSSNDDVWAVGGGDGLFYSNISTRGKAYHATAVDEGGLPIWNEVDSQSTPLLYAVWGSGPGDVWAVGNEGTLRHWTSGATRWEIVPSPTTENLRAVWGSGPNDVWAVGELATIVHYDGTSWTLATSALPLGTKPDLGGVWGSGPDDVWAVGKGVALHFTGKKPAAAGNP